MRGVGQSEEGTATAKRIQVARHRKNMAKRNGEGNAANKSTATKKQGRANENRTGQLGSMTAAAEYNEVLRVGGRGDSCNAM